MDYPSMERFCLEEKIVAIIDASHPFAGEISQLAIAFATTKSLPYLRYERPSTPHPANQRIIEVDSFSTLLSGDYLRGQRVLLATGYKTLPLFQSWHDRATLFVRILPHLQSLEVALAAGFCPERIIALRPPISLELEKALWQQWQISLVVTKANGKVGGENIKIIVAKKLNIPLIIIARPNISYPQQTGDLSKVGQWLSALTVQADCTKLQLRSCLNTKKLKKSDF
jgi:precorrin-6A/cobalt-precorrin-6A reductase